MTILHFKLTSESVMDTNVIVDAFRSLPQETRVELLCQLWDQVTDEGWIPELSDARKAELDRRWAEFSADRSSGLSWDQIAAELRSVQ